MIISIHTPTNTSLNTKRQPRHLLSPQLPQVVKHCRNAPTRRLDDRQPVERLLLPRHPPSLHPSRHPYATCTPSSPTRRSIPANFASRTPRTTSREFACSKRSSCVKAPVKRPSGYPSQQLRARLALHKYNVVKVVPTRPFRRPAIVVSRHFSHQTPVVATPRGTADVQ